MTLKLRLAVLLAGASMPAFAFAQDATEATVLKPITVTAQKRSAESKDIPAALSVEKGDDLALRKTRRREEAIAETPNAQTGAVTAKLYTSYTGIRGVGSALIESDPAVGLYVDGIGLGSTQAYSGSLLDVDRIEVLRGPQGTIYGRNNIAGSINIISNRPDAEKASGELSVDYGRFGTGSMTGVFNTPIGDNGWAARGALSVSRQGGSMHSTVTDEDLGDGRDIHGRFSIGGDITDKLEFLGIVDVERQVLNSEMFGMPEADFLAGRRGVAIDEPSRIESKLATVSGQFTYHLDNGDSIVSQTGYQHSKVEVSGNGFPLGYFAAYDAAFQAAGFPDFRYRSDNPYDGDYRQWSQELRYVSDDNDRFNWVAGIYGEYSEASREYGANSSFTGGSVTLGSRGETETNSLSVFADGSYALTDRWTLFGGLRVGHDKKNFDYSFNANAFANMAGLAASFAPDYSDSLSQTYVTPRIGIEFAATDDINIYASIASGYKSGGFNAGFVSVGDEGDYDSERLVSYELGLKSSTPDNRLQVDASIFYIDWRDQQVQGYNALTGSTPLMNAPRSQSYGGEITTRLMLDGGWSLRAAAGYADATYKDFTNARALSGMGTVDVSGNQQQFVSRFTGTLGVDYQWETGWQNLIGKVGANYQFRSAYYFDVQNTLRQPGYGLLNAYAGLENDRYAAFVYARNIGDKSYRTVASDLGNGTLVSRGDPLTVGASLKLKF